MTTSIEVFPPRSRRRCCGTCDRWREELRARWGRRRAAPWCNELHRWLPADLTAHGCAAWQIAAHAPLRVQLHEALTQEGRDD